MLLLQSVVQGFLPYGGHLNYVVYHPIAVATFLVISRNQLNYMVVDGNSSPSINYGRVAVAIKVCGDNLVLSIVQYAPLRTFRYLPHQFLDVVIFATFFTLPMSGQIHDAYLWVGMCGANELPSQLLNDLD